MSHFDDFPGEPTSGKDIALTPESEALKDRLLEGLERVIDSDLAHTYEVEDTSERSDWFKLPYPRYLSRVAFLKLDGFDDPDTDEPSEPPFRVAVQVKAHSLDIEKATDLLPDELDGVDLVWPDGLQVVLLDNTLHNRASWGFCYQPGMGGEFDFTGRSSGFVETKGDPEDPIDAAYGISHDNDSGATITEVGLDPMQELRVITEILQGGSADLDTTHTFLEAVERKPTTQLATIDPHVIRNSLPYFRKIIEGSLAATRFRDMLAWQQDWHQKRSGLQ